MRIRISGWNSEVSGPEAEVEILASAVSGFGNRQLHVMCALLAMFGGGMAHA